MFIHEMKKFSDLSLKVLHAFLEKKGFELQRIEIEEFLCEHLYVKGKQYVRIDANIYPRDYPKYFQIILGEGKTSFPGSDWNAVALWRVAGVIDPSCNVQEYALEDMYTKKI